MKRNGVYKKPKTEFENGGKNSGPTRDSGINKRPELFVPLGRQVRVMRLMCDTVKAKAHDAESCYEKAIYFIQKATLPKQTMRCLM